jgi:hypothetical protein
MGAAATMTPELMQYLAQVRGSAVILLTINLVNHHHHH